jgi:spore maturation protein SpmB
MFEVIHINRHLQLPSFGVNMYWLGIFFGSIKLYKIGQAVGGKLDVIVLIGVLEEQAAILLEMSTLLRKRGDETFF